MAERESAPFPTGAYVTGALLLAMFGFIIWLIANYPNNPAERSRSDDCESTAEPNRQSQSKESSARESSTTIKNNETTPPDSARNEADNKMETERQIAKYNCQLAIYTRDLAFFTKWLVYVTTGLIAIGLLQGYFLQRSVGIAQTAAVEARDAITATQATAKAANDHAIAAGEANTINRNLLIATQRPWVSVKLLMNGPLTYNDSGANFPVRFTLKNVGRTPAVRVWPHARPILIGDRIDLVGSQRAFFEETKQAKHSRVPGHTIFPDDEINVDLTLIMNNDAIAAAQEKIFFKDSFQYFIVGFTEYNFTFSSESHYTGLVYMVMKKNPAHEGWTNIIQRQDMHIERDDLVITPWFVQDSFFAT